MNRLLLAPFLPFPIVVAYSPTTQTTLSSPQRMPRYLSIRSKSHHVHETQSTIEDSSSSSSSSDLSKQSKLKDMSAKAAKGVKRQLRRLDDFLHHVTHTKHETTDDENDTRRRRTVSVPSPVLPGTVPSFRVSRSRSSWYLKHTSNEQEHHQFASVEVGTQTEEEMADQGIEDARAEEQKELSSSEQLSAHADPTTMHVEADVPDPFLLDEEGDARSEHEREDGPSSVPLSPTHIPLDISSSLQQQPQPSVPSATLNLNKDVPPPPDSKEEEEEEEEEEELPDLYLPSLVLPAMFLPIPNTDPLTTLLNKYIYPLERRPSRDVTGEWTDSDYHTLVMTNSWRSLAKMARDQLIAADPSDLNLILTLWHLRLSCLARLRLFNQTSAECTNLFSMLTSIEPPESRAYIFDRVLPFELDVMYTRLKYWAGDHMGYLDALAALLRKCRLKCRSASGAADETVVPMWKERGARVALIMASQMVEMKELSAAIKLLEPLASQSEASPALISSIARIYLQAGYLPAAKSLFTKVEADLIVDEQLKRMNRALLATTEGDWVGATENFSAILEKDSDNYGALNNLAVTLLNQGKAKEAIEVLETALQASPSTVVVAEPFLFNLSTLYELRATVGLEKKKELLITVAKWSGDGLRTTCLKMPAN